MLARIVNRLPNAVSQQLTKLYFKACTINQRHSHCWPELHQYREMDVKILPALQDNYMYLIIDKATNEAAIVDPVDTTAVTQAVQEHNVNLTKILTTHHHWDHAGGNQDLKTKFPNLTVIGGDDRIDALTQKVQHDSTFKIGNLNVKTLFTPCHTAGHVCYFVTTPGSGGDQETAVFTGDTLFLGGCGRFFEGNAEQMYQALIGILSVLPDTTKVFCGHEYTLQNLKFASFLEPNNEKIKEKFVWSMQRRQNLQPTVPGTIGEEKTYNPFMRVNVKEIQEKAKSKDGISTMGAIRKLKDHFKS